MFKACVLSIICIVAAIGESKTESWNTSIDIIHRQVLDEHMVFFAFSNPYRVKPLNQSFLLQYKCIEGLWYCPPDWVNITSCSVTDRGSRVFYSCSLPGSDLMLFNTYLLRGSTLSPAGWKNSTLSFKVRIPVYPKLENLTATAIDHSTVKLSWNKVALLSDLQSYKADNIEMRMKILNAYRNVTNTVETILKPWTTSTLLHNLMANQSYSLQASYHFVVSGLHLPSSTIAGPVIVHTPLKVVVSLQPFNQTCVEITNMTGQYFNISWTVPSNNFPSTMLVVNLRLQYRTTFKVVSLSQLPSSLESVVVVAGRSLSAAIEVCNSAGCSSKANTVCTVDDPSEQSVSDEFSTMYGMTVAASILALVAVIGIFLLLRRWKRKRLPKTEITPIGPRQHNPYDEALSQFGPYENGNLQRNHASSNADVRHSENITDQEDRFMALSSHISQPDPTNDVLENPAFNTRL